MTTAIKLLLLSTLLSISACQDWDIQEQERALAAQQQELEVQGAEITDLRQRLSTTSTDVQSAITALCDYVCESRYDNCILRVDIYQDLPGREPPRGPGPDVPGCAPFDCETDEERELAEENPAQSCSELKAKCKEDCIERAE